MSDKFVDAPIGNSGNNSPADGWGNIYVQSKKNGKVAWRKFASKSADGKQFGIRLDESDALHKAILAKADSVEDGMIEMTVRIQVVRTVADDQDDDEIELVF